MTIVRNDLHDLNYPVSRNIAPVFFRPPLVVLVDVKELGRMRKFMLIGLHARPFRAYSELNGLVDTYVWAMNKFNAKNALILGDLNADCEYFGPVDEQQNFLVTRKKDFLWLVENKARTNTAAKPCAFDRSAI